MNPIKTIQVNRAVSGRKTINVEDLPPEAWNVVFGQELSHFDEHSIYNQVSWIFRGIDILANTVKSVPFVIENLAGDIIDESGDYKNACGFFPRPKAILGLLEMALTIWGNAYLYKQSNLLGNKVFDVRYLLPTDIKPVWQKSESGAVLGLLGFERKTSRQTLGVEDIVYFWKEDPWVEFGPATSSRFKAALPPGMVIYNIDTFANLYFERGAIKTTLLAVSGNPPEQEKERIKNLWQRLMTGLKNAFGELVINMDAITPVTIGEGLESISDTNLVSDKRESIATALGIPHSILFSGAANYSVSQQDEVNLYTQTVIPDIEFIDEILNIQLFNPAGYSIRHDPESMDIFQEDENERAAAMVAFMNAIDKAGTFEMAQALFGIYGIEVSDQDLEFIKAHFEVKEARAAQIQQGMQNTSEENSPPDEDNRAEDTQNEMRNWRNKVKKAMKQGKAPADVSFRSTVIPSLTIASIQGALENANTPEEVNFIFSDVWNSYP